MNDSGTAAQIRHMLCAEDLRDSEPDRWIDPAWLYRYFDASGSLIYVGMSFDIESRDSAHYEQTAWRQSVARIDVELFPTRKLAELAERRAIFEEEPQENFKRLPALPYEGTRDAWFLDQQGGLIGCRKASFHVSGRDLRPA